MPVDMRPPLASSAELKVASEALRKMKVNYMVNYMRPSPQTFLSFNKAQVLNYIYYFRSRSTLSCHRNAWHQFLSQARPNRQRGQGRRRDFLHLPLIPLRKDSRLLTCLNSLISSAWMSSSWSRLLMRPSMDLSISARPSTRHMRHHAVWPWHRSEHIASQGRLKLP